VRWSGVSRSVRESVFHRDRYAKPRRGRHGPVYETQKLFVYLSVDHVVPRSKGGTHDASNLQTLCTECNGRKSDQIQ
jgi:5-methylcytosine-specific restriction endonuclease McrA